MDFFSTDLFNMGFVGLMTIGFVNVLGWFRPTWDSKLKFGCAVAFAFAMTFVPAELGNIILDKLKLALSVGLASSGVYKLTQPKSPSVVTVEKEVATQ